MYKKILVPLDGSPRAERALPVAARIVKATGGSLLLLRVINPEVEYGGYLTQPLTGTTSEDFEAEKAEATHYLAEIARSDLLAGIEVHPEVHYGASATSVLAVAHQRAIDAIVMCSHGDTGFKRWVLGSVAQKVVSHSSVPVLVLREGGALPTGPHPDAEQPLRMLVSLDGSHVAEAAVEPAAHLIAALAAPGRAALHLLRVVDSRLVEAQSKDQAQPNVSVAGQAKHYLSALAAHLNEGPLAALNLSLSWSIALDLDIAHAIIRVAENGEDAEGAGVFGGCDVIGMATHGRGGLQRWAMGSVTERVLGATQLPLLVIRSQEQNLPKRESSGQDIKSWQALL